MSKTAIIHWSGTGNTDAMADIIKNALSNAGAEVDMIPCDAVDQSALEAYGAVALGCPSMGAEVLEESEFEPMWQETKAHLAGKKVALFGSYGWGDGEWMRNWVEEAEAANLSVVANVICQDAPDDTATAQLEALAKAML